MYMPFGLTAAEIRVLQEFRRVGKSEMTLGEVTAIKHPTGGGESPAWSLVDKGFLSADEGREKVSLTERASEFLAYDPKP